MGNFKDNESLIEAWMQSPGHRENILNPSYREIGIAVKKGIFNGETVWLAVQHFGTSIDICFQPNEALKIHIERNQQEIERIRKSLIELENELQAIKPKRGVYYQQKLEEYNELVKQHNNLLAETNTLVVRYNDEIKKFNQCVLEL